MSTLPPLRCRLIGASGRMGHALIALLESDAALAKRFIIQDQGPCDVVIDFSAPEGSLAAARVCATEKVPMLVCTTGFTPVQKEELTTILAGTTWAFTPNTSPGVLALHEAVRAALNVLPAGYTVSIVESHHAQKKDKPSGTAKSLAEAIASAGKESDIHSLRGGSDAGTHTVTLAGHGESLEFTHRAQDRSLFARGAFELAAKLHAAAKHSALNKRSPLSAHDLYSLR
ncbi:MAG: hypothetical protein JST16_07280 [Bdellovibrionales bacterium]|nr:hypothetical protein [Bdellovibrionales bacterium]